MFIQRATKDIERRHRVCHACVRRRWAKGVAPRAGRLRLRGDREFIWRRRVSSTSFEIIPATGGASRPERHGDLSLPRAVARRAGTSAGPTRAERDQPGHALEARLYARTRITTIRLRPAPARFRCVDPRRSTAALTMTRRTCVLLPMLANVPRMHPREPKDPHARWALRRTRLHGVHQP